MNKQQAEPRAFARSRTVTVYQDPITEENPEGEAVIVRALGRSLYKVRFTADADGAYTRRVREDGKNAEGVCDE